MGLESLMDALTDNWHSKQIAIKDNCVSLTQYSDEDGEEVEVYKFRKGFDETKFKWTDQEKIAKRRERQARTGLADPAGLASDSSMDDQYDQGDDGGGDSEISAAENASIALSNGDRAAAAAGFDAVLAREPNRTDALSRYAALLLSEQRDLPRAEAMLRRALSVDPDDTSALVHLGLVLTDLQVPLGRGLSVGVLLRRPQQSGLGAGQRQARAEGRAGAEVWAERERYVERL